MAAEPTAVAARGVSYSYRASTGVVRALDEVDLDLPAGCLVALVGPTGSGKSSLLRLLALLEAPEQGWLRVAGTDVGSLGVRARRRVRRRAIGYVAQEPSENVLAYLDADEHLDLVARARRVPSSSERRSNALDALHLSDRRHERAEHLSGGEQQRLAFAMATFGDPALLVADEPTAELDRASAGVVTAALRARRDAGGSVVVGTHDPDLVAAADVVVRLEHGRVIDVG
jgi:ABC-type lipoprotein export system ATPase subunit